MGPAVGKVAERLGKPLMPWQQYVADVALEIDPDTGRLAYSEFGLTVPRQSGKSTFILAKFVHRGSATGFFGGRQRMVYTAQTRIKAREKWEDDYAAELEVSPAFRGRVTVHKGPGREHIRFKNGSKFGIEANTEKAGHGGTLDEAYIDEAFSQVDNRLEQAFRPAMITRLNRQLGWISTAGWSDGSTYLRGKVSAGRTAVEQEVQSGLAYFEWAAEEGDDPGDPDVWARCMPALGHTITVDAIRGEYEAAVREGKLNDFKRAYLNLWVPRSLETDTVPSAINLAAWVSAEVPVAAMESVAAFAVDVSPDLSYTSVAAAGPTTGGARLVELVRRDRGTLWVAEYVIDRARRHGVRMVAVDGKGQAKELIEPLQQAGLTVLVASSEDLATACGDIVKGVDEKTVIHGPQLELDKAVQESRRRNYGDGLFAFSRRTSLGDITPLYAVTLAAWAANQEPPKSAYASRSLMVV